MLPDIRYTLPVVFLAWCGAAWAAFNGPIMLAYPAMWAAVAAGFFALDRWLRIGRGQSSSQKVFSPKEAGAAGQFDAA